MHSYFHLPAKYIGDPARLVAYFESRGFRAKYDRDSGWLDIVEEHRIIRLTPRSTRIFANLIAAVADPENKTEPEDSATVLESFRTCIDGLGGIAACNDFNFELDFIVREFAAEGDLNALLKETRHHHSNLERHVSEGEFESAAHHRDLRDASMIKLVDACKFYD